MFASLQSGDNAMNSIARAVRNKNLLDMDTRMLTPGEVVVTKHLRLLGVTGSHFATHLRSHVHFNTHQKL